MAVAWNEFETVQPKFAANGTAGRNSGNAQHQHACFRTSNEAAANFFPEVRVSEIVAHEKSGFAIEILQSESHAAGAIHFAGLVKGREVIRRIRLDRDHLPDPR